METAPTPRATDSAMIPRVYIVDSHPLIRRGLSELIAEATDMNVCGEAEEGAAAFHAIMKLRPDVVIVEISLNGNSGIELIKSIRDFEPMIGILVVSMHDECTYAPRTLMAGARGFVSKRDAAVRVLDAIRCVHRGKLCFSPQVESAMMARMIRGHGPGTDSPVRNLSDRELEIGQLIGTGATTREIAARLGVSIKTIESHRTHIKEKLGLPNNARLMQFWVSWIAAGEKMKRHTHPPGVPVNDPALLREHRRGRMSF